MQFAKAEVVDFVHAVYKTEESIKTQQNSLLNSGYHKCGMLAFCSWVIMIFVQNWPASFVNTNEF